MNFDSALITLLREVKYLKLFHKDIPASGESLYQEGEKFRKYIASLDLIVAKYNNIISTLIPVEVPLMEDRLTKIDRILERGLSELNWRSEGIDSFISSVLDIVLDVDRILFTMKENVEEMENIMGHWSHRPLVERRDGRKFLSMKDCRERIMARSLEIELQGGKIHSLLRETRDTVQVDDDEQAWVDYVSYINEIIKGGFHETVRVSLEYLGNNMNDDYLRRNELPCLFEVRLMLQEPEVVYDPPMLASSEPDLKQIFIELMNSFTKIGKLVKRVNAKQGGKRENYFQFLNEDPTLRNMRNEIIESINITIQDCLHFKNEFMVSL